MSTSSSSPEREVPGSPLDFLNHFHLKDRVILNSENITKAREAVRALCEIPGLEGITIDIAHDFFFQADDLDEYEHAANFLLEAFLAGQHLVMTSKGNQYQRMAVAKREIGLDAMRTNLGAAETYIRERKLTQVIPALRRFQGKYAAYIGEHAMARDYYQEAISMYEKEENLVVRARRHEISAFLSHSLIMMGEIEEAINLAFRAWNGFFISEDGVELRKHDYYTWAIWASAAPVNIWEGILESEATIDIGTKKRLRTMLSEADKLLKFPNGKRVTDKDFRIRKGEIAQLRKRIRVKK